MFKPVQNWSPYMYDMVEREIEQDILNAQIDGDEKAERQARTKLEALERARGVDQEKDDYWCHNFD